MHLRRLTLWSVNSHLTGASALGGRRPVTDNFGCLVEPEIHCDKVRVVNPRNPRGVSRRSFLKRATGAAIGSLSARGGLAAALRGSRTIALINGPDDPAVAADPAVWGIHELFLALVAAGARVRSLHRIADAGHDDLCIVVTGVHSSLGQSILGKWRIEVPSSPESLCLAEGRFDGHEVLVAAGSDARGLVYALTELADRVRHQGIDPGALRFRVPVIERPASRTRSVMRTFCSEVEDKAWFYDADYWREYLTMLATSRFNRLNFTLGMAYNYASGVTDGYFVFPYPFFVAVPGYQVKATGLTSAERDKNLRMLKFIGAESARRGLRLQLGLWTLAYRWPDSPHATYRIDGLNDEEHPPYCRDALAMLLAEVPQISGVTFRVHEESGIPIGQHSFWQTQFEAIARCGRTVEIDLHGKNLPPATLKVALETGQPPVISPKFCGEHMGLPYHPASIRSMEMTGADRLVDTGSGLLVGDRTFTRYGYADYLSQNRTWDVVFRIWPGTQRFLLSGDPKLFSAYSRAASFCGAAGFEWTEPLFFKGRLGSGGAGGRCAYADPTLVPARDFEKFAYTYRLWGRLAYDPAASPDVWRRMLRRDFGSAALAIEGALAAATHVLPLFTLVHAQAADCQVYWPDIYTNMPIADLSVPQPDDTRPPRLFGNVSSFDPQLFASPDACGDDLIAGRMSARYSPLEVATWLQDLAAAAAAHLTQARTRLGRRAGEPPFRRIEEDVLIQRGLALFFAAKLRSAVLWRIHDRTGERVAGEAAIAAYRDGRDAWAVMATRAARVYRKDIAYGGDRLGGHWMDRIPAFDRDIEDLSRRLAGADASVSEKGSSVARRAVHMATMDIERPPVFIRHSPASGYRSGVRLPITLRCEPPMPSRVTLHYRHVNQAERWQSAVLLQSGGEYAGEIPAAYTSSRFPLQYYFEIEAAPGRAALFPALGADLAGMPYHVVPPV